MTDEELSELRMLVERLPLEFRINYHQIEAKYPEHWKGVRDEMRGAWFSFGETRPMGVLDAQSVVAVLNAARALLDLAAEALERRAAHESSAAEGEVSHGE